MRALSIASTGMLAQQKNLEVTSNNLANMTTVGFKQQKAHFNDLLYQNQDRVGTKSSDAGTIVPTGIQMGVGVKLASTYRITHQGTLDRTENSLDLAINGKGYFQIERPDGTIAYTRDGTFSLNQDGEMVNSQGFLVLPGIAVPEDAKDITIGQNGIVQVSFEGQVDLQDLGQIEITNFINEAGLEAIGGNLFLETEASGDPIVGIPGEDNIGVIMQGFVETSNVNPINEITNLIAAQRAYEMNSKVITTTDEMMQSANSSKR